MPSSRSALLLTVAWLLVLFVGGTVVLELVARRATFGGETSYAAAAGASAAANGDRIQVDPPLVKLVLRDTDPRAFDDSRDTRLLSPADARLEAWVVARTDRRGLARFHTFEVRTDDRWTVRNDTTEAGRLDLVVPAPDGASVLHDVRLEVDGAPRAFHLGTSLPIRATFAPGDQVEIRIQARTRGTRRFAWTWTAARASTVMPSLSATIHVDVDGARPASPALPMIRTPEGSGERWDLSLTDVSLADDLGVDFGADAPDLGRARTAVSAAPIALLLLLVASLVGADLYAARVSAVHHVHAAVALVLYFILLPYMARFIAILPAAAGAAGAALAVFAVTVPSAWGRGAAVRWWLPHLLVLTLGFTGVQLTGTARGLALVGLVTLVLVHLLVRVARVHGAGATPAPAPDP